ncbi:MAG: tyrosine--tRNA ligase [bacterium]
MNNSKDTQEKISTLIEKGVSEILPSKKFLESLLIQDKKLRIYAGFDPTGPTLHLGHTIQLRKLRHFQDLGHEIIFLIGDFTARIGDPTDKTAARKQLTEKEIKTNLKLYKKQAEKFISFSGRNGAKIKFNNDWLGKMKFADVLELASHMTVDQMLKRDMFARRIEEEKPIYIHEFMYPLMQGYDSVYMQVDGEVGGNDQLFNMLAGRTLLKQLKNKEKFVITTKLLEDANGKKMGKTEGNMVSLIDTPEDMYGKIMSWTDGLMVPGFELCTDLSMGEIADITKELENGAHPRTIKMCLAYEITKSIHGEKSAQQAQDNFVSMFQKKEIPTDAQKINIQNKTLEEILIENNLLTSKGEVRRMLESGAIKNLSTDTVLKNEDAKSIPGQGVYKIGKAKFIEFV